MLSKDKKAAMQASQAGSRLLASNVKIQAEEVTERDLTIQDYDKLGADTDEKHHYFAVTFDELPGNVVLSGSALTKLIDSAEADGEDIRGEKIRFGVKIKLDGGRTFMPCTLL